MLASLSLIFFNTAIYFDVPPSEKEILITPLSVCKLDSEGFIVTDSFHACLFSIIFGKPFLVIGNKERGLARYKSLFKMLSLEKHLLYSIQDYNNDDSYEITEETTNRLNVLRNSSIHFLTDALK